MNSVLPVASALLLAAACAAAPAPRPAAQPADVQVAPAAAEEEVIFTLRQGGTARMTERSHRTQDRLQVELTTPTGARVDYTADLRPDASVAHLEVRQFPPGAAADAAPVQRSSGTFQGDTVLVSRTEDGTTETDRRATVPGVVPFINPSPSLMEQIVRRARVMGGERVQVPVWITSGGGQNVTAMVEFSAPDAAVLTLGDTQIQLQVDRQGRVLGGSVPAQMLSIERAPAG